MSETIFSIQSMFQCFRWGATLNSLKIHCGLATMALTSTLPGRKRRPRRCPLKKHSFTGFFPRPTCMFPVTGIQIPKDSFRNFAQCFSPALIYSQKLFLQEEEYPTLETSPLARFNELLAKSFRSSQIPNTVCIHSSSMFWELGQVRGLVEVRRGALRYSWVAELASARLFLKRPLGFREEFRSMAEMGPHFHV